MLLEMLFDFQDARPGLTLTTWAEDGVLKITAMRASGEHSGARFIHRTQADPMLGELTRALSEIAEALEQHDLTYPAKSMVAA